MSFFVQGPQSRSALLGEQLGQTAGQGFSGGLQQQLQEHHQQQQNKKQVEGILPLLKEAGIDLPQESIQQLINGGVPAQKLLDFALTFEKSPARKAEKERTEAQVDIEETINNLVDELTQGKTGFFNLYNKLTRSGRESRAYFDELAVGIEKRLALMVGKGTLSKPRFEFLIKNLPSSSDTDATNRGKLRALAKEFKVEIKNPEFLKTAKGLEKQEDLKQSKRLPLEEIFK